MVKRYNRLLVAIHLITDIISAGSAFALAYWVRFNTRFVRFVPAPHGQPNMTPTAESAAAAMKTAHGIGYSPLLTTERDHSRRVTGGELVTVRVHLPVRYVRFVLAETAKERERRRRS
jgi:hypothetical protein